MKTKATIMGILLLAAACHQSDEATFGESSEALVVIEGTNAGAYRSALFTLDHVVVKADGQEVPARIDRAVADLAKPGEQLALRLEVPADARDIEVVAVFDSFGGYDAGAHAGAIDARGAPLRFQTSARQLAAGEGASIRLDLGRSLAQVRPEEVALTPNFVVTY